MPEDNYSVTLRIEKCIFVEGAHSKEEAIENASERFHELMLTQGRNCTKVFAVKTSESEEKSSPLTDEQIADVQKTSLQISNFNRQQINLLKKDLEFYAECD